MYYAHATSDDDYIYIGGGVSSDKDAIHQMYRYNMYLRRQMIHTSIPQSVLQHTTSYQRLGNAVRWLEW